MLISYVRFLWISLHREDFQDRVLAELLPPLEPDGTSHLWEAVGRRFTGLDYRDADRLSKRNKEFIRGLFPDGDIYVSLLSPEARAVVGKVGPRTRGVEKLLRRIGFRYWNRVDPFDGGPHFVAPTDEILLVQRSRIAELHRAIDDPTAFAQAPRALVAREHDGLPHFHAIPSVFVQPPDAPGTVLLPTSTCAHLGLSPADRVALLPLD